MKSHYQRVERDLTIFSNNLSSLQMRRLRPRREKGQPEASQRRRNRTWTGSQVWYPADSLASLVQTTPAFQGKVLEAEGEG